MTMTQHLETKSPEQAFEANGYFIARALVQAHEIEAIRQDLLARIHAQAEQSQFGDAIIEPLAKDDFYNTPLEQRFRKLNELHQCEHVWNYWLANPRVIEYVSLFLGPDILNKYASAFLKPAHGGASTPWHQDIGLWRDANSLAMNAWLAIDPATKANGCLQFVKASHTGPVIEHVMYEDSIHAELPRDRCKDLLIEHIELAPGDVVFWHSHLWHYSPPNESDDNRMGCGAVWVSPEQFPNLHQDQALHWAMRDASICTFPPPPTTPNQQ